ncbi:MAG: lamin tail domain-containing protein [Anaerolineae bacterium]
MTTTKYAENVQARSRSRVGVEITEIWNWGWAEHAKLTNTGDQPQEMSGWSLGALKEGKVFRFPLGLTLKPGQTVTIHTGANATLKQNPPSDLYWDSEPVWVNRGDIALLFDVAGSEVARYVYRMHGEPDLDAEPEKRLIEDDFGFQIVDASESQGEG